MHRLAGLEALLCPRLAVGLWALFITAENHRIQAPGPDRLAQAWSGISTLKGGRINIPDRNLWHVEAT